MFRVFGVFALLAFSLVPVVFADPVPTTPAPGDKFTQGDPCTFTWVPDTTGKWKVMNVELMTGDNFNMIHLTTVASVDGTDKSLTSFSYTCPAVTPNSPIYFYQFSTPATDTRAWTTRFAIVNSTGEVTPPTERTQPETNEQIPWGIGMLINAADAKPPPPNGGPTGNGKSSTRSSSTSSTSTSTLSRSSPVATFAVSTTDPADASTSALPSSAPSTPTTTAGSSSSAALVLAEAKTMVTRALLACGCVAVAFAALL